MDGIDNPGDWQSEKKSLFRVLISWEGFSFSSYILLYYSAKDVADCPKIKSIVQKRRARLLQWIFLKLLQNVCFGRSSSVAESVNLSTRRKHWESSSNFSSLILILKTRKIASCLSVFSYLALIPWERCNKLFQIRHHHW